jgi:hypothetical protein
MTPAFLVFFILRRLLAIFYLSYYQLGRTVLRTHYNSFSKIKTEAFKTIETSCKQKELSQSRSHLVKVNALFGVRNGFYEVQTIIV